MITIITILLSITAQLVSSHSEGIVAERNLSTCDTLQITQLGVDIIIKTPHMEHKVDSLSLSADGKIAAIGVTKDDISGLGKEYGLVRIFEYSDVLGWSQRGGDIVNEYDHDKLGASISLSADGDTVAIGVPYNDFDSGHVRIYGYSDILGWSQLGRDIEGGQNNAHLGKSVSLSEDGKTVAIGANEHDGNAIDSGRVSIYGYNKDSGWTQIGGSIDGLDNSDESGYSVSLSADGKTVAIGAPLNDGNGSNSGHVRVYRYVEGLGWIQISSDIVGESIYDNSGYSVSLSADGETVAIGAPYNDRKGTNSGHVRIYKHSEDSGWTQVGSDIDGVRARDNEGFSVSLSADGKTVAVGAPGGDGIGANSGRVRIYGYSEDSGWTQSGSDINGRNAGDFFGRVVSLSADGKTVAGGAKGYARIFSDECTIEATKLDTEVKRLGVELGTESGSKFIISKPNLVTQFQKIPGQHGGEVLLSYNITTPNTCDTTFSVRIYKEGCSDYIEHSQYIDISSTEIDGTETPQNNYDSCLKGNQTLDVFLDIKEDAITKSPFFQFTDSPVNSYAEIKFCQRLMLSYDMNKDDEVPTDKQEFYEVVNFQETDIKLNLDFSQMFSEGNIDIEENSITKRIESANIRSDLQVYLCDATTGVDISEDNDHSKIAPGSTFTICFSTDSTNMGIRGVRTLTFRQETTGISISAITDGNPNPITTSAVDETTSTPNKTWKVLSRLILPFFDSSFGGVEYDVTASGTVIMQYQDDSSTRRYLRREASEEETLATFEISIGLVEDDK